jgi:hypothetical protein
MAPVAPAVGGGVGAVTKKNRPRNLRCPLRIVTMD